MTGATARFGVLGPLTFERDGQLVALPAGRERAVLGLLLAVDGPLSRDRLIDELWGEHPPASAVSMLHVYLSKLRVVLGDLLVREPAGYRLTADQIGTDAREFEELLSVAWSDPGRAGAVLSEALGLFRGEPLCDVECEGPVAQWRRSLEERRLEATVLRVDADLAAGAGRQLVAELGRLVAEHPYEERLAGQLMLALYRAGRQADALEAYQRAHRRLDAELGLEPGEQLRQLQRRILEHDPTLLLTTPPSSASPAAPVTLAPESAGVSLPRAVTRLVGRDAELAALTDLLADEARLVTLTGPGGVGKTRLLLELAQRQEPHHASGAVFVRLEQVTDPALVAAEIAGGVARRDGADGLNADGLEAYLRDRDLLLAVDNFEHLLPAAPLLGELLSIAPKLTILVSSRSPLGIRGETVFDIEPLRLPGTDADPDAAESPAVALFIERALAGDRKLQIDSALTSTVARICRALDGLPLAIELAAASARLLTLPEIAEGLAHPLAAGEHALRDLPDRQQTLEATIRWSYDLLTPEAQSALRSAGVFLGGFTVPALDAVNGGPARPALNELLTASLVRRQTESGRFELLELVRAFALDRLAATDDAAAVRARHRQHFAAHVIPTSEAFERNVAPGEAAAPLLTDHGNIRAALENAIETGDRESAVALALGLRPVWMAGALRQEGQGLVDRLLSAFSVPAGSELSLLNAAAFAGGYGPGADARYRQLAERAEQLGDPEMHVMATGNLFAAALTRRDRHEMAQLRPTLLAAIRSDVSPRMLGWSQYYLALDAYVDGRFQAAADHARQCAEHAAAIGHVYMLGTAASTRLLADSAHQQAIAQPDLVAAIDAMRRSNVPALSAGALWLVARYAAAVEPGSAGQWLAHAERIVQAINSELWPESDPRDEAMALLGMDDISPLLERTPPLDHTTALAAAAEWLGSRDPTERAPRAAPPHRMN